MTILRTYSGHDQEGRSLEEAAEHGRTAMQEDACQEAAGDRGTQDETDGEEEDKDEEEVRGEEMEDEEEMEEDEELGEGEIEQVGEGEDEEDEDENEDEECYAGDETDPLGQPAPGYASGGPPHDEEKQEEEEEDEDKGEADDDEEEDEEDEDDEEEEEERDDEGEEELRDEEDEDLDFEGTLGSTTGDEEQDEEEDEEDDYEEDEEEEEEEEEEEDERQEDEEDEEGMEENEDAVATGIDGDGRSLLDSSPSPPLSTIEAGTETIEAADIAMGPMLGGDVVDLDSTIGKVDISPGDASDALMSTLTVSSLATPTTTTSATPSAEVTNAAPTPEPESMNDGGKAAEYTAADSKLDDDGRGMKKVKMDTDAAREASASRDLRNDPATESSRRAVPAGLHLLQEGADSCESYRIVPYVSAVHSAGVTGVAATSCMRWVFTGCDDGFVRKYDFFDSMNGKLLLTQTQKQSHVETIQRAGVLLSYWDNEERPAGSSGDNAADTLNRLPTLSPVHSIAAHSRGLWVLTGMAGGNVNLWSVRVNEGCCQHIFRKHKGPVSCLALGRDERSFVSGSWDSSIHQWDLDRGSITRSYTSHASQVSSLVYRPTLLGDVGESVGPDASQPPHENVLMSTSIDGMVMLWDQRDRTDIRRRMALTVPEKTPKWCISSCWSPDGSKVYCGRRIGTVDEYDFRQGKYIRSLRLPGNSGPVSCIAAMPNNNHLICASHDNIRLWNLTTGTTEGPGSLGRSKLPVPFVIVPGHHGGVISQILIDSTCRYMITTSGNRGWEGQNTNVALFYEITPI